MQFPLINFRAPATKRGKARMEEVDTFSIRIGEDEITEIRKHLAYAWNADVTMIAACWNGQIKRRYTVENGKIVKGVHFAPTDYECRNPLPLRIPPEPVTTN